MPTDERFMNLTEEQMDLIYEHYKIDNPPPKSSADPDFNNEEVEAVDEHFVDPDFDEVWDTLEQTEEEGFSAIDSLDPQSMSTQNPKEENLSENYIEDEWEEV